MTALQLLLLGFVYTISCTAIPFDHIDEDFLQVPRTWNACSIATYMLWLGSVSSAFDILTYVAVYFFLCLVIVGAPLTEMTDPAQIALFIAVFQTGWFIESMWTQTFVIHMLRTEHMSFIESKPAFSLTILTLVSVGILTILLYIPGLSDALSLCPLPLDYFGLLLALMVGYLVLCYIIKRIYIKRFHKLL